jgi:hypothetical protein
MDLSVTSNAVTTDIPLPAPLKTVVRFKAANIRKERTGVHAAVYIGLNDSIIEWDEFNLLRREDRTRLCNAAHKLFPEPIQSVFTAKDLNLAMGEFFLNVWTAWTEHEKPAFMVGLNDGTPPAFLLKPYIIQGGGTILFGEPGMGKSFMGITMSVCVDAGLLSIWPTTETRVLFVNLERSEESVQRRLGAVNKALGLAPERELLILNARGRTLKDVKDAAEKGIKDEKVGLVVLDSLSRAGAGDLTENAPANTAMDILNGFGIAWVALAHSPRGDNSHVYGSQMFDAAADIVVQQTSERKETCVGVALNVTKGNDIGKQPLSFLAFGFDEAGLNQIWKPEPHEFPGLVARQPLSLTDEIALLLSNEGSLTLEEIAAKTDKSWSGLGGLLANDPRFLQPT